jgi:hypothetical protein
MTRAVEQSSPGGGLHDLSEVHDCHPVAHVLDHAQVMSDEEIREPATLLQVLKQVDDLGLDRNVESRDWLVGNQKLRVHGECAGDADSLPLPTAELVRIPVDCILPETNQPQHLENTLTLLCSTGKPVDLDSFGNDCPDTHPRVQRSIRILKNDLHPAPDAPEISR